MDTASNIGVLLPVRLETRFYPPDGGGEWRLRVLVVPDEPSIDRHDPVPFEAELDSVERLWQTTQGDLDSETGRIAWQRFVDGHGGARAAWLTRTFPPLAPAANGTIRVDRPPQTRTTPYFGGVVGFPEELEFWMGRGGNPPQRVAQSSVQTDGLQLDFPDPGDPSDTRWWSSWDRAREVGLGIEIELGPESPDDVDVLYIVGLGTDDPAGLFGDHRDSGALAVIQPGTPTNTVDGAPAADLARDPETWRQIALAPDQAGWGSQEVSWALTGSPDVLGAVPGSFISRNSDDPNHRDPGLAMVTALWPVLWGHALKDIWGLGEGVQQGGLWAAQYVVPEGPLPPIRINDQPYGLLPVTSLRRWQPSDGGLEADRIEDALKQSLIDARALWSEAALSAGNVVGADTERLLRLLGRTPSSSFYEYRYFISLQVLYLLYWAYDEGLDDDGWLLLNELWESISREVLNFPVRPQRRYISHSWPYDISIPLVAPPNVPRDTTFREYLRGFFDPQQLIDRSAASWLDISDGGTPSASLPRSLLARLLLHARFVTAAEVYRAAQQVREPALEPVVVYNQTSTRLGTWAAQMTNADLAVAGTAAVLYREVRRAIGRLLDEPVGELDRIMRATLDTAAYRIDPWITAYPWRRLQYQAATREFRLGVYGWVDAPQPGTPGPTDGGLLHAPSEQQALAAVILRDKAIHDAEPTRWDMDLESATIRRAEQITEEVRLGSHIQEILGREIERIAASRATIESLRSQFPMRREHAGRRVCNGEEVLRADPSTLPLNNAQRAELEPLRRALDTYGDLLVAEAIYQVVSGRSEVAGAAMDAATGLTAPPDLEVISTRRTGRGVNTNVVVALPEVDEPPEVAFDTSPGEVADPAVAEFLTTVVGRPDAAPWRWQVLRPDGATQVVLLSQLGLAPIDAVLLSEEELARLALLAAPEGSVLDIRWLVRLPDGTTQEVLLSQLGVAADEAMRLSEEELASLVLATAPEGSTVGVPEPAEGAEAQRRARRIIDILGRQPATPADLVDTGAIPSDDAVRAELRERYERLRDAADLLIDELGVRATSGTAAEQREALLLAARWGITPAVQVEATLQERVSRARDTLQERLNVAPDAAGATALAAHQLATTIAELAAPEGQIAVLSRIDLGGWPTTFTAAPTLDQDWLTLNAPVRESLARLEAYQLDARLQQRPALAAWTNRSNDPWQVNVPATATGAVPASRLVAIYGPEGVLPDDPADLTTVAVGLLDSWGETIPDVEQATGAAFGFNAPAARAPQAILLAVPPVETEPLTPEVLVDIVAEARELAWARMASPAELHAFKAALPLMMLPASGITAVEVDS
jgi:hypothetical protein